MLRSRWDLVTMLGHQFIRLDVKRSEIGPQMGPLHVPEEGDLETCQSVCASSVDFIGPYRHHRPLQAPPGPPPSTGCDELRRWIWVRGVYVTIVDVWSSQYTPATCLPKINEEAPSQLRPKRSLSFTSKAGRDF